MCFQIVRNPTLETTSKDNCKELRTECRTHRVMLGSCVLFFVCLFVLKAHGVFLHLLYVLTHLSPLKGKQNLRVAFFMGITLASLTSGITFIRLFSLQASSSSCVHTGTITLNTTPGFRLQ